MSSKDRAASGPPMVARRSKGFAGLYVGEQVGLVSALGGLCALAGAFFLGRLDARTAVVLREALDERIEAGRVALSLLEDAVVESDGQAQAIERARRAAARDRASFLVLLATEHAARKDASRSAPEPTLDTSTATLDRVLSHIRLERGEHIGLVDLTRDRVSFGSIGLAHGATLSTALPDLARAWSRGVGERPPVLVTEDAGGAWALGPALSDGDRFASRVEREVPPTRSESLHRATQAIVALATESDPFVPSAGDLLLFFFVGALGAGALGFLWARARLGSPLSATEAALSAFIHGDPAARANESAGCRDARDVARGVNALIDLASKIEHRDGTARDGDVRAAAIAVEALGRGDLTRAVPSLGSSLEPLAAALETARRDMLERLGEIHRVAVEIAAHAVEIAPGAKKIGAATVEQFDSVKAISGTASEAAEDVRGAMERITADLARLAAFGAEGRTFLQAVKVALRVGARRAQDLRESALRVEDLASKPDAIGEALDLLSSLAGDSGRDGQPSSRQRISSVVGQARAARDAIARDVAALKDDLREVATSLDSAAQSTPEDVAALEGAVTAGLHAVAMNFARSLEATSSALRSLERATRVALDGAAQIERATASVAGLAPRLGASLSTFEMGTTFEKELLARLERARAEVEDAGSAPDGLTEEGRAMMRQVIETSELARGRLARLVQATEAAIDAIRG